LGRVEVERRHGLEELGHLDVVAHELRVSSGTTVFSRISAPGLYLELWPTQLPKKKSQSVSVRQMSKRKTHNACDRARRNEIDRIVQRSTLEATSIFASRPIRRFH
jgi:hypothetical protein